MIVGDLAEVVIERPAHGGVGVGRVEGDTRVVLVRGGLVGDVLEARITKIKRSFLQAELVSVRSPAPIREAQRCPAAALGAGCCDYGVVSPSAELELKATVLVDQLRRIGRLEQFPQPELVDLTPHTGWRTRWRLGVDAHGRAGVRRQNGTEVIWQQQCIQAPAGVLDGIVGDSAARFTPNAEVVVAVGSDGIRTVCESSRPARGRRVERALRLLEGPKQVHQQVGDFTYTLSATAFWQAHSAAAVVYTKLASQWLSAVLSGGSGGTGIGWDLYGGVGLFVPALLDALRTTGSSNIAVHSVDTSPTAHSDGARALQDLPVTFHRGGVDTQLDSLPTPDVVVLDPPRQGAGPGVIAGVAAVQPRAILHVGCDPATFARDSGSWSDHGYRLTRLAVVNAFPGTHHSESFGLFEPSPLEYEDR